MDVNLESLIEKVRAEAVEEAQKAANQILANANAEADKARAEARAEAERTLAAARSEAQKLEANSQQALRQAARDAELMLKERLTALFDRVFRREVVAALSPDKLLPLISKVVTQWAGHGQLEVVVSEADRKGLEGLLRAGLSKDLADSVTVRASNSVTKGFRFEVKGSSVYYDFTDETIAATLRAFINPSLQAMLNGNDG